MNFSAVIVTSNGRAVAEPLRPGKDLLEIFPNAKHIFIFNTMTAAAYFAQAHNTEGTNQ